MSKQCPSCRAIVKDQDLDCLACGIRFDDWKKPPAGTPAMPGAPLRQATPVSVNPLRPVVPSPKPSGISFGRIFLLILLAAGTGLVLMRKNLQDRGLAPEFNFNSLKRSVLPTPATHIVETGDLDFDQSIQLKGSPSGLVWTGKEFLSANRMDPWGLIRVNPLDKMTLEPVTEPVYGQKLGFNTLGWNGSSLIGLTPGSWYQMGNFDVFALYDPATMQVKQHKKAPEHVGAVVWDGARFWAGGRKNTEDAQEPAFLYELDANFNVVNQFPPPGVGCQGLAWDGKFLWWVDVFSDKLYLIDVQQSPPQVVHTYETSLSYLSGIAFDGENIWVAEYDKNRLLRLNPRLASLWRGGDTRVASAADLQLNAALLQSVHLGDDAITRLIEPLKTKQISEAELRKAVDAMTALGSNTELMTVFTKILADPAYAQNHQLIRQEMERLKKSGGSFDAETPALPSSPNALETEEGQALASLYMDYHRAFASGDINQLKPFMSKSKVDEMENTPHANDLLAMAAALRPKNVSIAHVALNGDSAEMTLRSMDTDNKASGSLQMTKESGVWKVDKEDWTVKMN